MKTPDRNFNLAWYFFFFASGFCGLVYEVVWLRLAMASFGVNAPLVSTVLSIFMAGLGLGSWAAGKLIKRTDFSPVKAYALCELLIGVSGALVPSLLFFGRSLLENLGGGVVWGTLGYYAASGVWIALSLLPSCALMGATFPLAMASIRRTQPKAYSDSFGRLYLANVGGAAAGAMLSAFFLIEMVGFRRTALLACAFNTLIFAGAMALDRSLRTGSSAMAAKTPASRPVDRRPAILLLLFATGAAGMCSEVVWIRLFIPYLGSTVYTFAAILTVYLLATFFGSSLYRALGVPRAGEIEPPHMPSPLTVILSRIRLSEPTNAIGRGVRWGSSTGGRISIASGWPWVVAGVLGLLPLVGADPRLPLNDTLFQYLSRIVLGIAPFCALLGFLTPMLVDRWSAGDPEAGGSAYAVNVVGSLLGPLLTAFFLLPYLGERGALLTVMLPLTLAGFLLAGGTLASAVLAALLLIPATLVCRTYEDAMPPHFAKRDYEATVVAGGQGKDTFLLVNGVSMTRLAPVTKWMAHFPLAVLGRPADKVLVVCFGMGTTFRSALSWGVHADAVDLVLSVPAFFGFFHKDAPALLSSGRARIFSDDGRRYLERTPERYDLITIDPPPPVEAAASSLLYSEEFYKVAAKKLKSGGILQQWLPGGAGPGVTASVAKAFQRSFSNRLVFKFRTAGGHGIFFLGSDGLLAVPSARELAARLPRAAQADISEWGDHRDVREVFAAVLEGRTTEDALIAEVPNVPPMRDDLPVNEYFVMKVYFPELWSVWAKLRDRFSLI